MSIVETALRRPYTFLVMAVLIVILGVVTIQSTPTDVFPVIDIPVASVIWAYSGVSPNDMEKRIVTISERAVYHVRQRHRAYRVAVHARRQRHQTLLSARREGGSRRRATHGHLADPAQPAARHHAAADHSVQRVQRSDSATGRRQQNACPSQQFYDYAQNFVRTQLATVRGASTPSPYGGKPRQIMVDLDPQALQAKGLTAYDVSTAINAQNLILPSGTAKMGSREYNVSLNSSPDAIDA